MVAMTRH